jgi:thiol-disulfide isomerase/thioredoxin
MRITILLLCLALALGCNSETKQTSKKLPTELSRNIGETFDLDDLVDSSGNQVTLNFSNSEFTLIDFWFTECPPCIKEMQQFEELLKGKETKLKVVSVSINQPWYWRQALQGDQPRLAFLKTRVSNWEQVVLKTKDDPKLRNSISADRAKSLEETYGVSSYPAYFVLDRNGRILQRPESAVEFLKGL